ncbi:hypothetical protein [Halobacillus sp. A5]|uniref:hypothetical protein n=1 Tax=Halobacillus sp. A5 TaxID=2880263 RepID=UPI0020A64612|nr:hypothetical protein [Halobacillus sp. A5]MCP3026315.1 hypothetical protein [Halobacillus sp. A5]
MNNQRISSIHDQTRTALLYTEVQEEHINHWHYELENEYNEIHQALEHGLNRPCKIVTISIYSFINSFD